MAKQTKKTSEKSSVPSVEKALDILDFLSGVKEGATMKELVEGLGRSMGEIYRVVVFLAEQDYLALDKATGRYSLTLKLFELSHRHDPTEQLISNAMPLMQRFSALTDQSCHLGVLNRTNVLILASVPSPRPAGYSVRTGAIFPAQDTSTGTLIVAFSEKDQQERYLKRLAESERVKAQKRLDSILEQGYDRRESLIVAGVLNLSVPVFNVRGIAAALTCGYIVQEPKSIDADETLRILLDIAGELSQSLGHATSG